MAMVAAAIGSAVAWVGATAAAVGTATSMVLTYAGLSAGQIAALGAVASFAGQFALSAATTALMTPSVGRGGSPLAFKADPSRPISGVMGRFGVGGGQLHANVWGKDNLYLSFAVALSLGPIQSIESFTAAGTAVTFPGAQGLAAATEPYINKMWQTTRLGLPTDAYLSPPTGVSDGSPAMTEWTSSHTLPGFAQAFWTMKNNSKREGYQSGVPAPLWTLLGMKVWDPRLDSTYPGGSGSQRRDDWTTWAYSANPYLHALAWVRGHHKLVAGGTIDTTKRLAGVGAPDAAIDIAAFVEGANVADANAWEISGEWTTADDKWQTLAAMLQAGGGVPVSQGAQISCMVEAPRTSLMTVTGEDIVGSVSLNVMASRRDRPNTVIPRVRLEAHKFEEVALGAVTSSTYVTEDAGESRVIETAYRFVGLAKQGAELAGYGLANTRETLKASIPCKPYLLGLRAGDAFTVTEPELGLSGQKFVVMRRSFDPASAIVTLDVRSETDAKHAWALGQSADAPASPSLTAPDPVPATPDTADWTVAARPVESSGVQQPGLIVTGPTVGENIGAVLIEYSTSSSGPWQQAYSGPPTIATVEINGLVGGDAYYVGITYWSVRGVPSAQLVKGPYTAPGLTSGDVVPITPGTVAGTPSLSISTSIVADGSQVSRLSGSWTPPTDALTYIVEIDNGTVTTQFAAPDAAIADRIVTTGPTYRYRVKAMSRTGTLSAAWSSWSSSVAAGGDATPPGVITSPTITGQLGTIAVTWTNPTDDDFSHVNIYRHTANVSGSSTFVGSVLADNATLYVPATLTTYYFWATTVDRTGNEGAKTALGSAQALPVGGLAYDDTVPWGDITTRPTELTDGRITTALNASGVLQTALTSTLADTSNLLRRTSGGLYSGDLAATEGATWGTNLTGRPANLAALAGSEGINNAAISISAAGALSGAGGGTVTIGGLGYTGHLNATRNTGALADLNTVGTSQIDAGAVTTSRLATDAVTANEIATGAVGSTEIATGAVTTSRLATDAVTANEIAAGAVGSTELAAGSVTTSRLATDAVTANEIAAGAVGSTELAAGSVTTSRIAADAVTSAEIATGAVGSTEIAALAVTTAKIAAGAVTSTELGAGAVTTSRLATDAVTANEIAAGAVTATELGAAAVTYAKLSPTELTDGRITAALSSSGVALKLTTASGLTVGSGVTTAIPGQPYTTQAGDAEAVTFPVTYSVPPLVIVAGADNLVAMTSSGDYYQTSPVGVTTTGFTGQARKKNPGSGGTPTARTDDGAGDATTIANDSVHYRHKELSGVSQDGHYLASFQIKTTGAQDGSEPIYPRSMNVGFYGRQTSGGSWTLLASATYTSASSLTTVTATKSLDGTNSWTSWTPYSGSGTTGYEYKIEIISGYVADKMCLYDFTSVAWTELVGGSGATDVTALADGRKITYLVFPLAG